jgi:hypothetical protein
MKILSLCKQGLQTTLLLLFFLIVGQGVVFGQQSPNAFLWAQAPTSAPNTDFGAAIAQDWISNDYYVAGIFTGTITFGTTTLTSAGDEDIYLVKYDCSGTPVWAVSIGGVYKDNTDLNMVGLSASGDEIFITGSVNLNANVTFNGKSSTSQTVSAISGNGNDIFLAAYTRTGNLNWVRTYGSAGSCQETGISVFGNGGGNVAFTGRFCNTVNFGPNGSSNPIYLTSQGGYDMFVLRAISVFGTFINVVNVTQIGGTQDDMGIDIYSKASGGGDMVFYVSGIYGEGGGTAKVFQPYNNTSAQTLYTTTATNFVGHGAFVGRIDAPLSTLGTWAWFNNIPVTSYAAGATGVSAFLDYDYMDNRIYVAGSFDRNISITDNSAASIALAPSVSGNKDVYTTAFDINGNFIWSSPKAVKLTNTSTSNETVNGINHDFISGGTTYKISGSFNNTSTFNGTTPLSIVSAGGTDIFVAQITETNGNLTDLWRAGESGNEIVGGMDNHIGTNESYITGKFENSTQIGTTHLAGTSQESYFAAVSSDYLRIINTGALVVPGASLSVDPAIVSLYTGYNWFLNGVPLGVTTTSYVPTVKGLYYVEAVSTSCQKPYRSNELFIGENCTQGYKHNYPSNYTFGSNTTISGVNEIFEGVMTVGSGVTVTIRNSNILMRPCSKIIVKGGGRLIIQTSTLFSCQQWKGIEVQKGGIIQSLSNSHINDAVVAVYAITASVQLQQTTFENNKVSVALTKFTSAGALIQDCVFDNMYVAAPYCHIPETDVLYPYITSNNYIDVRYNTANDQIMSNTFTGVASPFAGLLDMHSIYVNESQNTGIETNDFTSWMGYGVYITGSSHLHVSKTNTFTGGEINIGVGIYNSSYIDVLNDNQFTSMENWAIETKNSFKVTIDENNQFNSTRGIYLEKTIPYYVHNNTFNNCSSGVESYVDDFAPVYQTFPPACVISANQFIDGVTGVIVSPKVNPFTCSSSAFNALEPGNVFEYVLISCNNFDNNTYGLVTTELMIDQYMTDDPANTFGGGSRDWDIISYVGMLYNFSGAIPNAGLPNNPVALNGVTINSSTIWSNLFLNPTSTVYADCDYNPNATFPDAKVLSVEENEVKYALYPNPAKDVLTISGIEGKVNYFVSAINGQQIVQGTLQNGASTIDVSNMADGVYVIKLVDEAGKLSVFKFVKAN